MSSSKYADLWLEVQEPDTEWAAELLCELGSAGAVETPLPDGRIRVLGSVPLEQRETAFLVLQQRAAEAWETGSLIEAAQLGSDVSPDIDWEAVLRHHHKPFRVGGVLVRPPWIEATGEPEILLEPGMAFGTGNHETTRLCLQALADVLQEHPVDRLLDVGTGSGILAFVPLRLLPQLKAVACDTDTDAIDSALKAAAENQLQDRIELHLGPVNPAWGPFPLVVANLQWNVFQTELPPIAETVAQGGTLLCSGLLLDQANPMAQKAVGLGLQLLDQRSEGEWCLLRFRKG